MLLALAENQNRGAVETGKLIAIRPATIILPTGAVDTVRGGGGGIILSLAFAYSWPKLLSAGDSPLIQKVDAFAQPASAIAEAIATAYRILRLTATNPTGQSRVMILPSLR